MRLACGKTYLPKYLGMFVKSHFCALVRPIFVYGAVVLGPHTADNSEQIERGSADF